MQWPSGLPVKCRDNSLCVSLAPGGPLTLAISLGREIKQCRWLLNKCMLFVTLKPVYTLQLASIIQPGGQVGSIACVCTCVSRPPSIIQPG